MSKFFRNTNMVPSTGNFLDKEDNIRNILDESTGAIKIITESESRVGSGLSFLYIDDGNNVAASAKGHYMIYTGNDRLSSIKDLFINAGDNLVLNIYEGDDYELTAGTRLEGSNFNRNSNKYSGINVFSDISFDDATNAKKIYSKVVQSNSSEPALDLLILQPGMFYLIELENNTVTAVNYSLNFKSDESIINVPELILLVIYVNNLEVDSPETIEVYYNEGETFNYIELEYLHSMKLIGDNSVYSDDKGQVLFGTFELDLLNNDGILITPDTANEGIKEGVFTLYFAEDTFADIDGNPIDSLLYQPIKFIKIIVIDTYEVFDDIIVGDGDDEVDLKDAVEVITYLTENYKFAKAVGVEYSVPILSWIETDEFLPDVEGSYTFTAVLDVLPEGYSYSGLEPEVTIEVVVEEGSE